MCDWGTDVVLRVPIPASCSHTGEFRWDEKPVDSCLAPMVAVLNAAGVYTGGSCCGHGKTQGYISLHDGRVLVIGDHAWAVKVRFTNPEEAPCVHEKAERPRHGNWASEAR